LRQKQADRDHRACDRISSAAPIMGNVDRTGTKRVQPQVIDRQDTSGTHRSVVSAMPTNSLEVFGTGNAADERDRRMIARCEQQDG
jgi:hypothetical protein